MTSRIYQQQHLEESSDDNSSISVSLTESSPLIGTKHQSSKDHTTVRQEFIWLLKNSLPIIGTYLLQSSFQLASIFTLGHLVSDNVNDVIFFCN